MRECKGTQNNKNLNKRHTRKYEYGYKALPYDLKQPGKAEDPTFFLTKRYSKG